MSLPLFSIEIPCLALKSLGLTLSQYRQTTPKLAIIREMMILFNGEQEEYK